MARKIGWYLLAAALVGLLCYSREVLFVWAIAWLVYKTSPKKIDRWPAPITVVKDSHDNL